MIVRIKFQPLPRSDGDLVGEMAVLPRVDERVVVCVQHTELVYEVYRVEHLVAAPSGVCAVVYVELVERRGPREDYR